MPNGCACKPSTYPSLHNDKKLAYSVVHILHAENVFWPISVSSHCQCHQRYLHDVTIKQSGICNVEIHCWLPIVEHTRPVALCLVYAKQNERSHYSVGTGNRKIHTGLMTEIIEVPLKAFIPYLYRFSFNDSFSSRVRTNTSPKIINSQPKGHCHPQTNDLMVWPIQARN